MIAQLSLLARCPCGAPLDRPQGPGRPPETCADCRENPSDSEAGARYLSPSGALVASETAHRARLWRRWAPGPRVAFVGLNPSTATAEVTDRTFSRCLGYARSWGFGGLEMLNLWPIRSTDPAGLWEALERPEDRAWMERGADLGIRQALREGVRLVVLASGPGSKGRAPHREMVQRRLQAVAGLVQGLGLPLGALTVAKGPAPGHPLYLPGDLRPRRWEPGREALGPEILLPID